MNLPDKFKVLVITLSDRAFKGEYSDLSGPAVKEKLKEFFGSEGWTAVFKMELIPDDAIRLSDILADASENYNIIITTGGTGIGPNDITTDTVRPLLSKEIPASWNISGSDTV